MHAYEIRIIRQDRTATIYSVLLLGDHAAIRRAHNLAQDGDLIEVWRGLTCVYSTIPEPALLH